MNTIICKQLEKYKDKNGRIIGYRLVDQAGVQTQIKSEDLKNQIKTGTLKVVNLTLTKDGRLIDGADEKNVIDREESTSGVIEALQKIKLDKLQNKELSELRNQISNIIRSRHKHSAFGVQIDFDIPEFIILNPKYKKLMQAIDEDRMVKRKFKDKSMADGEFFKEFKANRDSLETGIVGIFSEEGSEYGEVWDTISTLTILWLMHQNYEGLNPESTKEDIIERISNEKWLTDLCWRYSFLQNKYLKCIVYKGEKD